MVFCIYIRKLRGFSTYKMMTNRQNKCFLISGILNQPVYLELSSQDSMNLCGTL